MKGTVSVWFTILLQANRRFTPHLTYGTPHSFGELDSYLALAWKIDSDVSRIGPDAIGDQVAISRELWAGYHFEIRIGETEDHLLDGNEVLAFTGDYGFQNSIW
ncbi:MAG: hypothetical protein H6650_05050 [Ardenticatenales bacterium]|nr:hypothetical protein [Ardenticatenales bacterium]